MSFLLTTDSVLTCPHGGVVQVESNGRTQVAGGFVLRASDATEVKLCSYTTAEPPHPCVKVVWFDEGLQNSVAGQSILTSDSRGKCYTINYVEQGNVLMITQERVSGK